MAAVAGWAAASASVCVTRARVFCAVCAKNLEEVADIWDISGDIRGSVRREKIET